MNELLLWLIWVNVIGFFLMGADKVKAKRGRWRIPEKMLLLPALLGGTPGVIAGMKAFHHKTRHRKFKYGLPALLAVQLAAAGWFLYQVQ